MISLIKVFILSFSFLSICSTLGTLCTLTPSFPFSILGRIHKAWRHSSISYFRNTLRELPHHIQQTLRFLTPIFQDVVDLLHAPWLGDLWFRIHKISLCMEVDCIISSRIMIKGVWMERIVRMPWLILIQARVECSFIIWRQRHRFIWWR